MKRKGLQYMKKFKANINSNNPDSKYMSSIKAVIFLIILTISLLFSLLFFRQAQSEREKIKSQSTHFNGPVERN